MPRRSLGLASSGVSVLNFSPVLAASPAIARSIRNLGSHASPSSNLELLTPETAAWATITKTPEANLQGVPGNATFLQTVFNSVNLLVGIGLLAYPNAFAKCGWVALPLLILLAFITRQTAMMLGEMMDHHPDCKSFSDMGTKAFGRIGTISISIIFFLELLIGGCTTFLIVFADNLHQLITTHSVTFFAIMGTLIVLPTTWFRDLSRLSYLSLLGVAASIVLIFAVAYTGFSTHTAPGSIFDVEYTQIIVPKTIPFSLGILMVGFGGHAVFPSIYSSMKEPKHYPVVLNVTFFITVLCYGGVAAMGYLMYGTDNRQEITLNLPKGWVTEICLWMIVVSAVSKFALSLAPVSEVLESALDATKTFRLIAPEDDNDINENIVSLNSPESPSPYGTPHHTTTHLELANQFRKSPKSTRNNSNDLEQPLLLNDTGRLYVKTYAKSTISRSSTASSDASSVSTGTEGSESYTKSRTLTSAGDVMNVTSNGRFGLCSRPISMSTKLYIRAVILRTILTALSLGIAIAVPNFDQIMAFVGSLLTFTVSVAFPPAAYIRLMDMADVHIGCFARIWYWTVAVFGLVCAVLGTIAAVIGSF